MTLRNIRFCGELRPMIHDRRPSVVVIGGANIDIVALAGESPRPRVSNPGRIRISAGGAGRNVAENLARLGIPTRLIAAVDAYPWADFLLAKTAEAGVELSGVVRVEGRGNYYVAVEIAHTLEWAVSDMAAAEALTPGDLDTQVGAIRGADIVVIDANLSPATIRRAVELAAGRRVCLLPVSVAKARRVRDVLTHASLLVLTAAEAEVLTGRTVANEKQAMETAKDLRARGRATVVMTMGEDGIAWTGEESVWLPAPRIRVVDPSGAGDAVAAVAVYSMLAGWAARDAAPLALAAAAVTVGVEGATHPRLSLELLRTHA